ncbi:MAG: hypothetical protein CR972_03130 [Candidatus Moraniibacteriota bacterium]|nr:MAG: hypothetical protein CR972_03130 [Candidatus Moranbacteria bacterium]
MFKKIEKTVQNVRQQPEHIRMRWVWISVIIGMIFVTFIWMMSLRISFFTIQADKQTQETLNDFQKQFSDVTETLPSENSVSIDELLKNSEITQ